MRKILLVALVTIGMSLSAQAFTWIGIGYVILNVNGGGDTYYDTDQATGNPDFNTTTITINVGQSILIGGEVATNERTGNSANGANIAWSGAGAGNETLPYDHDSGGNDVVWDRTSGDGGMADIGSGLSAGTYTLSVYMWADDGPGINAEYHGNGGANYRATIVVNEVTSDSPPGAAPEPGTLSLAAVAGLVFLGLRRRLKG
ncbi:MAG: PEP-CTERM sorting domain-containing protein [Verrucomicrobia bacterium]|nr:PEP-CTERM sorting domain-containing protein [Verrucomicrobiota bacterium]